MASIDAINNCLPQTQCTRCGYPCCADYAAAIHNNEAKINLCPPGDKVTIAALSKLTKKPILPLDNTVGPAQAKTLALIDEAKCIGCVLCIKACPVDAILGANKQMHTVIQAHCTGCELCLPVCPTDCIKMMPLPSGDVYDSPWPGYSQQDVTLSKKRFEQRALRKATDGVHTTKPLVDSQENKMDDILAAVRRRQASR